jgi:hypothetical protein
MTSQPSWPDYAQIATAVGALLAVVLVALMPFVRRPRLTIVEDESGIHTQLEGPGSVIPWIRLIVRNARLRRAATNARVLVEGYREVGGSGKPVTLGSPEAGWPSTAIPVGGGPVIFSGGERPVDFAALTRVNRDEAGNFVGAGNYVASDKRPSVTWNLELRLAMHAYDPPTLTSNYREFLPAKPNGWTVRLLVGEDDGAARAYEVDVNWHGQAPDPAAALNSVQVAVRRVPVRRPL